MKKYLQILALVTTLVSMTVACTEENVAPQTHGGGPDVARSERD